MKQQIRIAQHILIGALALLIHVGGVLVPGSAHGQSSAAINSINARVNLFDEGCLYAFARVEVLDEAGDAVLGLDETHFAVEEDAGMGFKTPLDYFVIPPNDGAATRAADFIFVMDNSLSLHDEQEAVRDNLIDFIDALTGSGIDYQLGLTRYGQTGDDGAPIITNGGNLTDDAVFFRDNIWAENTTGGNIEPGYHGVQAGLQGFNLRADAQTVVILISDEPLNQDDVTQDDAIAALETADATFYGLVPMGEFFTEHAEVLADTTGGQVFDITSNFNDILNAISEDISGVYTVGYRPADAFADTGPNPRDVEITVDAGTPITAGGSYTPGARPAVRRAPSTATMLNASAGNDLVVTAEGIDLVAPAIGEGTLFYRPTGSSSPFETVPLTGVDDTFEATIPASAMQAPGIDFFFQVSDGMNTVTAPGAAPATRPFQIGVGTNSAPEIVHSAPSSFTPGSPLTLAADVADDALDTVTLHYRAQGRIGYDAVAMTDRGSGRYEVSLPPMIVPEAGLDYYIRAEDAQGVASTYGTPDQPVVLGGCATEGGGECTLARLVDEEIVVGTSEPDHISIEIEDLDDGIQGIGFVQQTDPDDPMPDPLDPDDWEPSLINSTATFLGSTDGTFVDAATLADAPPAVIDNPGVVWVDSDLVAPHPTSAHFKIVREPGSYRFGYFAAVLNGCGGITYVDPVYEAENDDAETDETVTLARNYPNPFASATTIDFQLPEAAEVSLVVYDMLGRKVATLVDSAMEAGTHTVHWDGRWTNGTRVASGVYFYRFETASTVQTRRMVVVR